MGSWDQNLHVLEPLARHFGSPNQSYQAPTVTQMPKIYLIWRISADLSDQNVHFGESEPNIRKIGNTPRHKNVHISEKIYTFSKKKKICASFPKNIRIREKIGDLTMKANFI